MRESESEGEREREHASSWWLAGEVRGWLVGVVRGLVSTCG